MGTSRTNAPRVASALGLRLALAGAILLSGGQAQGGDIWLGVGAGWVKAEGVNATVGFGGDLRIELGRHFAVQPDVGYWRRTETVSGISVSASDTTFGATFLGLLPLRPVKLYGGAGPSIHHISGNVASLGFPVASDSLTRVGLAVLGGLDLEISRSFAFFFNARYDWVTLEGTDPDSFNQSRFFVGFRFEL